MRPCEQNLQIKLHETRRKIVQLEMQIEDLKNDNKSSLKELLALENKLKQLKQQV